MGVVDTAVVLLSKGKSLRIAVRSVGQGWDTPEEWESRGRRGGTLFFRGRDLVRGVLLGGGVL